jgi:hypothetical protein
MAVTKWLQVKLNPAPPDLTAAFSSRRLMPSVNKQI